MSGTGSGSASPVATDVSAAVSVRFGGVDVRTGMGRLLSVVGLLLGGCMLWL